MTQDEVTVHCHTVTTVLVTLLVPATARRYSFLLPCGTKLQSTRPDESAVNWSVTQKRYRRQSAAKK